MAGVQIGRQAASHVFSRLIAAVRVMRDLLLEELTQRLPAAFAPPAIGATGTAWLIGNAGQAARLPRQTRRHPSAGQRRAMSRGNSTAAGS